MADVMAITLWQPWASLVAIGAKRYETRSWFTPYRGALLIHAAKKLDEDNAHEFVDNKPISAALYLAGYRQVGDVPRGAFVCLCDLTDCVPTERISERTDPEFMLEKHFGDYSPGRFAWKLENLIRLDPIHARGYQQLWNPPQEIVDDLIERGLIGKKQLTLGL